jgi:DNA polymerase-3 subunit epsilon
MVVHDLWPAMRLIWFGFKKFYYLYLLRRKGLPGLIRNHLQACLDLELTRPLGEAEFVVFDMETTGLHAKRGDRIVSISAVRVKQGRIDLSDSFHEIVDPDRHIPSETAVIHGILPSMVHGKPTFEEVLPSFISYVGSSVLVAHHAWLDLSFLNQEMIRLYRFPIQSLVIDTALLDRVLRSKTSYHGGLELNSTLRATAERYHVRVEGHHSSFGDALATAQVFQQMLKLAKKQDILRLRDLLRRAYRPVSLGQETSSI